MNWATERTNQCGKKNQKKTAILGEPTVNAETGLNEEGSTERQSQNIVQIKRKTNREQIKHQTFSSNNKSTSVYEDRFT